VSIRDGALNELTVELGHAGQRLDVFLTNSIQDTTRSQASKMIAQGKVMVNGAPAKAGFSLSVGDKVSVRAAGEMVADDLAARELALDILFEDESLIVLNKPAGIMMHPGAGRHGVTLVEGLMAHMQAKGEDLSDFVKQATRPGIVHRLDRDTSGVVVCAKNAQVLAHLAKQFQEKTNLREYVAILHGRFPEATRRVETYLYRDPRFRTRYKAMSVEELQEKFGVAPDGYRAAISHFRVMEEYPWHLNLVACRLETGRTHQIRVHSQYLGAPVLGDQEYGIKRALAPAMPHEISNYIANLSRQMLHARLLGFTHPITGEKLAFAADPPADMRQLLTMIRDYCRQHGA